MLRGVVEFDPTVWNSGETTAGACREDGGAVATAVDATNTDGVELMATTEGGRIDLAGDNTSVPSGLRVL